jgi:hypothetical protein
MATISAVTCSSEVVTVFVNSVAGISPGTRVSFAGLTLTPLDTYLNGNTFTVVGVSGGSFTIDVPGAPNFPSGSGSDTETGTVTIASPKPLLLYAFQDPQGNPLANGTATFRLTFDAGNNGPQVAAGKKVSVQLDANGTALVALWANDALLPAGSKYKVVAYSYGGAIAWQGEIVIASQAAPNYLLTETGGVFLLESGVPNAILLET